MAQRLGFELQDGEEVILFERRHPVILLVWLIPPVLLLVALGLGAWLLTQWPQWSAGAILMIWLFCLLPGAAWIVWRILDWGNDHYILTNQRVLHVERIYFIYESCVQANLDRVQDVRVKMPGLLANLFYYGDVVIETAGTAGHIVFSSVSKPRKMQRLIFEWAGLPLQRLEERREQERWEAEKPRWRQPHRMLWRMFFAVLPTVDGKTIIWRKHWWILFTGLLGPVTLLLALLALTVLWEQFELPRALQIVWVSGIVIVLLWIVWRAVDWRNDSYILTPDRVVDIEKRPFVLEDRLEASLSAIQDVGYAQPGFIPLVLGFGDVYLETAGELGRLTFDGVPDPRNVQQTIMERVTAFREVTRRREQERQRQEMRDLVEDVLQERAARA